MNDKKIISIEHVNKSFDVGESQFMALKDICLEFNSGEFTGLVGPSGSGKTTLLNIIGSLDQPTSGTATVLGQNISKLSQKESSLLRNKHLGFVFQVYNLLPVYTVYENVEFALLLQDIPPKQRKNMVMEALEVVGLDHLKDKKPNKLSGGEGQRVAIARAMVKKPKILIADEPTASLDAQNSHAILKTMKKLNETLGTTFLFSTHDEKVMKYLTRIIHLRDGKVEDDKIIIPKKQES